jgi:hypothetical protein
MSLTSELTHISAQFEDAKRARLAATEQLRSTVKSALANGRAGRARIMARHREATKTRMQEIFGAAAFVRGSAQDLIERLAHERGFARDVLSTRLRLSADKLQNNVEKQLEGFARLRKTTTQREAAVRRAYLDGVGRRVGVILANAESFMIAAHQDRVAAERVWQQHCRAQQQARQTGSSAKASFESPIATETGRYPYNQGEQAATDSLS